MSTVVAATAAVLSYPNHCMNCTRCNLLSARGNSFADAKHGLIVSPLAPRSNGDIWAHFVFG
jgi:hypothetical protein